MKAIRKLMTPRVLAGLAVVTGSFGATSLASTGGTAQADPVWTTGVVGVGSDVTQDLWAAYSGASPAPGLGQAPTYYTPLSAGSNANYATVQSYDANPPNGTTVVPQCIITRPGGNCYDRPNSSTAGIQALYDEVEDVDWSNSSNSYSGPENITNQFDFARSARGPKNTSANVLTFIPYARDGLGILEYTAPGSTPTTGSTLGPLTEAELNSLYTNTSTGSETINGLTVYACLTIAGSTPRSNLESALGSISDGTALAAAEAADAANYPGDPSGNPPVESGVCPNITQNSGNAFYSAVSALPANTAAVIPISAASWEAQDNQVALDRSATARANGVDLASITNAGLTILGQPYVAGTIGSGPDKGETGEIPNLTYYNDTHWGYTLYTVVPTSLITPPVFTENKALVDLFVGGSSVECSAGALATAQDFGFANLASLANPPATCGSTSTFGTEPNG